MADQNPQTIGAYHTADVPYWFGTFDSFNLFRTTRVWGDSDRKLSISMLQSLIALASQGVPDTSELKWPVWSARDERHLILSTEPRIQNLSAIRMNWLATHPPVVAASAEQRRPRD